MYVKRNLKIRVTLQHSLTNIENSFVGMRDEGKDSIFTEMTMTFGTVSLYWFQQTRFTSLCNIQLVMTLHNPFLLYKYF